LSPAFHSDSSEKFILYRRASALAISESAELVSNSIGYDDAFDRFTLSLVFANPCHIAQELSYGIVTCLSPFQLVRAKFSTAPGSRFQTASPMVDANRPSQGLLQFEFRGQIDQN
jgi:hypothetical protein